MLTKRIATLNDLDQLVELHMKNFDANEFSMRLGEPFVRQFYEHALKSENTRIMVGTGSEGNIFCFAIGFTAFRAFQSKIRKSMLLPLALHILSKLVRGQIREAFSITAYALEKPAAIPSEIVDHHIGLISLDKTSGKTPARIIFFFKLFSDTVQFVKSASGDRCWTSVFADNQASIRLINDVLKPDRRFVFRALPKTTLGFICTGITAVTAPV
jgi:hypothetical protein